MRQILTVALLTIGYGVNRLLFENIAARAIGELHLASRNRIGAKGRVRTSMN